MGDDIRFGDGIYVSISTAAVMVDIITLAEKLLERQNGQPLPPKAQSIRNDLRTCVNSAAISAHDSRKEVVAESVLAYDKSPAAAAKILGIKPGSVRAACNAGHMGRKVGDRWFVSDAEIETYRMTLSRRSA
jgi:hypothetical protein